MRPASQLWIPKTDKTHALDGQPSARIGVGQGLVQRRRVGLVAQLAQQMDSAQSVTDQREDAGRRVLRVIHVGDGLQSLLEILQAARAGQNQAAVGQGRA